jgi:hypothetical protein
MTEWVGLWVARGVDSGADTPEITKWHLCESVIADRKVTRCGRQMGDIEGTYIVGWGQGVENLTAELRCKRCRA